MFIKQLYTGCLSEAAYYIESDGEVAIIDPLRDIDSYLQLANEHNATIKYIFETHFHADFVSGHLDLAKATNAPIIYGPETITSFPVYVAKDSEEFQVGKLKLKVLHTPGHTLESTCYLLKDENGKDYAVFTGDTLFVGDVGRPDLAQKGNEMTMNDLAGMLYESLQTKIVPLADDVIVYPAHGPGSSCGKNLGPNTYSTIGDEKQTNYALLAENKETFVKSVTDGLAAPPQYFAINAKINKEGYTSLDDVLHKSLKPLPVNSFKELIKNKNAILLDTRNSRKFINGFIPGFINIGLEGRYAEWAGNLLSFDQPIILVTEKGKEKESVVRLARVGFENFKGYLEGGFEAWQQADEPIDMIVDVDADEFAMDLPFDKNIMPLDVRKEVEFDNGHVKGAINFPLNELTEAQNFKGIDDENNNLYVYCGGGYRSVIASSLLKKQGIHNLRNVNGGWNEIKKLHKIITEKNSAVLN